jgi:hypothetical protein
VRGGALSGGGERTFAKKTSKWPSSCRAWWQTPEMAVSSAASAWRIVTYLNVEWGLLMNCDGNANLDV